MDHSSDEKRVDPEPLPVFDFHFTDADVEFRHVIPKLDDEWGGGSQP